VLTVYSNGWASFVQHAIFRRKQPNKRLRADRLRRGYARALSQPSFWLLERVLPESAAAAEPQR